jgi:hypothetical protein
MIEKIKSIFGIKKTKEVKYKSLSDFFLHASPKERKDLFFRAAKKSNEDQLKVFNQSLKIKAN